MQHERWLITGASGQLGGYLVEDAARTAGADCVLALAGAGPVAVTGVRVARIDLADLDRLRAAVAEFRPTHLIHAAAMSAVGDCHADPARAQVLNVGATAALAEAAVASGARFLFTSTDMVFSGDEAPYREAAAPRPLSVYGGTKVAAEEALQAFPEAVIARPPLMVGWPRNGRETTLVKMVGTLRSGRELRLFTDEFRTPAWLGDVSRALLALIRSDAVGIWHVGGPERLSRYDLMLRVARANGLPTALCVPCSSRDVQFAEPRPADLSLDSSKLAQRFPNLAPGVLTDAMLRP